MAHLRHIWIGQSAHLDTGNTTYSMRKPYATRPTACSLPASLNFSMHGLHATCTPHAFKASEVQLCHHVLEQQYQ